VITDTISQYGGKISIWIRSLKKSFQVVLNCTVDIHAKTCTCNFVALNRCLGFLQYFSEADLRKRDCFFVIYSRRTKRPAMILTTWTLIPSQETVIRTTGRYLTWSFDTQSFNMKPGYERDAWQLWLGFAVFLYLQEYNLRIRTWSMPLPSSIGFMK